ncbi:MAG: hypothetical protein V1875_06995 [Candidatus Altiarchaeota archaeon]
MKLFFPATVTPSGDGDALAGGVYGEGACVDEGDVVDVVVLLKEVG